MKKTIVILIIVTIIFSITTSTFAKNESIEENSTEKAFEHLLDKLTEVVNKRIEADELGLSTAGYDKKFAKIEEKMLALGAEKLTKQDVKTRFNVEIGDTPNISLLMTDPPDYDSTNDTQIYGLGPSTTGGFTYYTIYATHLNSNSPLYDNGYDAVVSSSYDLADFLVDTMEIYAYKVIGTIPIISWLPYEHFSKLYADRDTADFLGMMTLWNISTKMKHCFIYDSTNDVWDYEGATMRAAYSASLTTEHVVPGQSSEYDTENVSATCYATYYNTISTQCNNSAYFIIDKIYSIKYKLDGSTKKTLYPPYIQNFSSY